MARTVGKHWRGPPGSFQATCDYCGSQWRRDQLHRDGSGLLACPDEGSGLDTVTLSQGNAANASERRVGRYMRDGANWDHDTAVTPPFVPPNNPSPAPQGNVGPTGKLSVLVLSWLRADTVTLNSAGRVAAWPDRSGRGNNFGLTGGAAALLTAADGSLGGVPTVGFDGATMWLSASFQNNAPMWVWGVLRQDTWVLGTDLFNGSYGLIRQNISPIMRLARSSPGSDNSGAAVGTWVRCAANYTIAGTDYLRLGATLVSDAGAGQRKATAFVIGAGSTVGASKAACSFAELLITAGEPTAPEQAALDAYGQQRYKAASF